MTRKGFCDVAIIGAGPGGYPAAFSARKKGASVVLIERGLVGGVCLNYGCIPSKYLLETGHRIAGLKSFLNFYSPTPSFRAPPPTLEGEGKGEGATELFGVNLSWKKVQEGSVNAVLKLRSGLESLIRAKGIEILRGRANFVSPGEIEVHSGEGTSRLSFKTCIVATGSEPLVPPPIDQFRDQVLTSESVFEIPEIPKRLLIVGGGAIGCELGCFFNAAGCEVFIVEMTGGLLPGEEQAVSRVLLESFKKRGIKIYLDSTLSSLKRKNGGWKAVLNSGQPEPETPAPGAPALGAEPKDPEAPEARREALFREIEAGEILVCAGRRVNTGGLCLEAAGIEVGKNGIKVDSTLKTTNSNVYAVGDVTGLSFLAHAASAQGEIAIRNAFGEKAYYDGSLVPRCLYTWPEAASIGLTGGDIRAQGLRAKTQRAFFAASGRALAHGETEGFVQVISDARTGRLLGAQIIGPGATENIHVFAVAMKARMTCEDLKDVVFAHPTFAESIREALSK